LALYFWDNERLRGHSNLGDNINPWLLSRVLGEGVLHLQGNTVIGIGTILNVEAQEAIGPASIKSVFTSGCGYSDPPVVDETWRFYAVRGHMTRNTLGLGDVAVGDGAILLPDYIDDITYTPWAAGEVVFMPHIELAVLQGEAWRRACEGAGLLYLSPSWDRDKLISALRSARLVITSAMHGAIIADALRTPWIPVSSESINTTKWLDWASALNLEFTFEEIPELQPIRNNLLSRFNRRMTRSVVSQSLLKLSRKTGYLSSDVSLIAAQKRLRIAAERLRSDFDRR
jgi:succinoglycan biosynthesis protein ExoV